LSLIEANKRLAGITAVRSILTDTREQSRALKLNLFGILNAGSLREFLQSSKWIVDGDTGDITVIDTIKASEAGYSIDNLAKDSRKLRHVLADGAFATCTYKASKTGYQPDIKIGFWAFDLNQTGTISLLRDYFQVATAMRLSTADAATQELASARAPVGRTIFNAEITLDGALIDRLFFDQSGQARKKEEYEKLGREALLATLPADLDPDILKARQSAVNDDQLWQAMVRAGSFPAISSILKARYGNSAKFETVAMDIWGDYLIVEWWAEAMAGVSEPLADLRVFLSKQRITDPHNNTLSKLRGVLNARLKSVIANAHDRFSQPWGLMAMDLASGGRADAKFTISSPGLSLTLARKQGVPVSAATAGAKV
jgi:hypothetical protein